MFRTKQEKEASIEKKAQKAVEKEAKSEGKKEKTKIDMNIYMKEYRQKNLEKMKQIEKCKYYKRVYDLDEDFIEKFGIYSADAIKVVMAYNNLIEKKPELKDQLLMELISEDV